MTISPADINNAGASVQALLMVTIIDDDDDYDDNITNDNVHQTYRVSEFENFRQEKQPVDMNKLQYQRPIQCSQNRTQYTANIYTVFHKKDPLLFFS